MSCVCGDSEARPLDTAQQGHRHSSVVPGGGSGTFMMITAKTFPAGPGPSPRPLTRTPRDVPAARCSCQPPASQLEVTALTIQPSAHECPQAPHTASLGRARHDGDAISVMFSEALFLPCPRVTVTSRWCGRSPIHALSTHKRLRSHCVWHQPLPAYQCVSQCTKIVGLVQPAFNASWCNDALLATHTSYTLLVLPKGLLESTDFDPITNWPHYCCPL